MGVQWLAAQVLHNGEWIDVVPDCRSIADNNSQASNNPALAAGQSQASPLPAANFHMIPYSNRIRDGRFSFNGTDVQLAEAEKHAIHGALRKCQWQVASSTPSELICEFDTRNSANAINWPWPIHAVIKQVVDADTLHSRISITNLGDSDMPVGTGWHPYFVRDIKGGGPTLTLPVESLYPDSNGDCLPDGAAVALPAALDFRQARALDPNQRIDCCLAGLSGSCHIHWQDAGIELIMSASDDCDHLVLFNPDMPHFAVEPVSNANDAFNLASQGINAGVAVLPAGETFSVDMTLQLKTHGA